LQRFPYNPKSKRFENLEIRTESQCVRRKISQKNKVLSELMEEHVALKKILGRFNRFLDYA
jgi:hypothetical protein